MGRSLGPTIVVLGVAIVIVGLLVWAGGLSWFGRLPGDIRINKGNTHVFIPITTMIVVSVALTVIVNLLRKLL